jgi:multimeric flavodoxin WrbA
MRRILGVLGSPRKNGNTHGMLETILASAERAGAQTEMVMLADLTIGDCTGCHVCWRSRECPLDDDMNVLYSRIAESDAIVFGTPVYWYGPTAHMKAFLDRFVYFNCPENREMIRGKSAVLAAPWEESGQEAAEPLVRMFELSIAYLEMKLAGTVLAPGVGAPGDILRHPGILASCQALGERLASDGNAA